MRTNEAAYFASDRSVIVLEFIDWLAMLARRFLEYRQRRADRDELCRLSDRELADIGLYRCDIEHILRR